MRTIIISIFLCLSAKGFSQTVIAGDTIPGDVYYDFIPDSVLFAEASHFGYPGDTLDLDLDQDGVMDIRIRTGGGGGLGGASGAAMIFPLGIHATVASFTATVVTGCCPSYGTATIADTLMPGDTISSGRTFATTPVYVQSQTSGAASGPYVTMFLNKGERYLGFKLTYPFDTLYGWILIENYAIDWDDIYVKVKAYSCNRNYYIGIPSVNSASNTIFPNPFSDKLYIGSQSSASAQLKLFDLAGKKVFEIQFSGSAVVNTSSLLPGLYFYEIKEGEKISKGKLIKQ